MSAYYFAYGSNMNADRMIDRGLRFSRALSGQVDHMALAFNKLAADAPHRSYANVVYARNQVVEGVLYQLDHIDEIYKMDPFEGAPRLYSREIYSVRTEEGEIPAWVYVANRAMIRDGMKPERWYLNHLLAGKAYLSDDYYRSLQQVVCLDDGVAETL